MGIPRKGLGVSYLHQGLQDFGIEGEFLHGQVSHDELDAITSAIVGSFFLAGRYEALSGPLEASLIIPDLMTRSPNGMVVGFSGRICAGKTTAARFLEKRGFAYTRFSMVVDDQVRAQGKIPDRNTRQQVGLELHESVGQRWLCEKVIERVEDKGAIVIDGLRFPEDHAYFAERFGSRFIHLHLQASRSIRESRYGEAERGPRFELADNQEVEGQIDALARLADQVICNDSSFAKLEESVLNYIQRIGAERDVKCPSPLL